MIGYILYYIKTTGDYITSKNKYIDYSKQILIVDNILLTKELIDNSKILDKDQEYTDVFTSKYYFTKLIEYAIKIGIKKQRNLDDTIRKNIDFITKIFF